jgi:hypothetical protein
MAESFKPIDQIELRHRLCRFASASSRLPATADGTLVVYLEIA